MTELSDEERRRLPGGDLPVYAKLVHDQGKAIILFSESPEFLEPVRIDRWVMDPQEGLVIAEHLAQTCFEARDGVKPVGAALKAEIVERHRMTLTHRVALMLGTLREDKNKSDGQVAQAVVEACLKEVF